uniref:Uncharacterized protein n=1 Tax=Oncorhynchus tshawytscha TaxID=74940 RepID=A0AAZ3SUZ1_ONCTS
TKDHKTYDHTLKENIPPFKSFTAQGKGTSCCLSLPLGRDYERKKQKLHQELRLDYRHFMAQVIILPMSKIMYPRPPVHAKRVPSRRETATLTEGKRGLHRGGHFLVEGSGMEGLRPEDKLLLPREKARLVRVDYDSEEDLTEEDLDLMERRRLRQTGSERGEERRQLRRHYKTDFSLTTLDNLLIFLKKCGDMACLTGAADADAALQRRKERYRQELQEQIAEQQRNKKREKDLELRVAVTGSTDPEKQADWIKPLGAVNGGDHARKRNDSLYPLGQGVDVPGDELNGRPSEESRERLPPEQPRMAFQSPLLESSNPHLHPKWHPGLWSKVVHYIGNRVIPGFLPHPPSTLADAHRSPYDKVYLYHGARNPLDPNPANCKHYQSKLNIQATSVDSNGIGGFPAEQIKPSKQCVLSYKEALRQQIQDRQERRRLDREERDRYEAKLEADMKNHDPWGRGGGGAPLRDSRGNLITDLHQMHKHNEEAYINPETWQKMATATMTVLREEDTRPPSTHRVSGRYRGFHIDVILYKIEEKRKKGAEERESQRLEEEKEEKRLFEQRECIQREYEEEQDRKKRKEMEVSINWTRAWVH